jgi:hypothetical protein
MSTIRKTGSNWQCMVRIKDHPQLSKSFKTNADAKRWGIETELKIRREDAGIAKISYPTFSDIGLRYITDVSKVKKGFINERNIIKAFQVMSKPIKTLDVIFRRLNTFNLLKFFYRSYWRVSNIFSFKSFSFNHFISISSS